MGRASILAAMVTVAKVEPLKLAINLKVNLAAQASSGMLVGHFNPFCGAGAKSWAQAAVPK